MRKNWLPEIAALLAVAAIAGLAVNYTNSSDVESAQSREAACVSSAKSTQIELDQAKKSLQVVGEEKDAAEYRLIEAESRARELKRQLEDIQAVKETLGKIADAVKKSNEKSKSRKLLPSTRPAPHPEKAVPTPSEPESKEGGEKMATGYAERMVNSLNHVRAEHGLPPLAWSEKLMDSAGTWAQELIKDCERDLMHDPEWDGGENLAKGYRTPEAAVAAWAGEEKDYDYSSNTCADSKVCGHYTQIVWADTTEFGCQQYNCQDGRPVLVCRFLPAGNVIGEKPY